jgi:hypothetical protein
VEKENNHYPVSCSHITENKIFSGKAVNMIDPNEDL